MSVARQQPLSAFSIIARRSLPPLSQVRRLTHIGGGLYKLDQLVQDRPWGPWTPDFGGLDAGKELSFGEGTFFYPGHKVGIDGPVPSIRLECLRDGIEDWEYLKLHSDRYGKAATKALISSQFTSSWRDYTNDATYFQSIRDQIAAEIAAP